MNKDEKKMIEEMAQVLCNRRCEDCELLGVSCGCKSYCTRLYNAGCRIIADDEIVIKKSERVNVIAEEFEELVRKETAREILQIIKDEYEYIGDLERIIAKKYGIELE